MKQACGYEYTNKLQNMYQDIAVSKNLADKFRENVEFTETPLDSDFRVKVLTHGCWPLSNDINVNLPIELTPIVDRFMTFYYSQHSGRKLMWLHKLSKVELAMNGLKQRYYIKVNWKNLTTTMTMTVWTKVIYVLNYFTGKHPSNGCLTSLQWSVNIYGSTTCWIYWNRSGLYYTINGVDDQNEALEAVWPRPGEVGWNIRNWNQCSI